MSKAASASPFSAGEIVGQKYRLVRQLGEGGMGVVWQAVNEHTGGEVALKLIVRSDPDLRQRLLREARACAAIRHRNVIQIHDVGQTAAGDPFLVMELLTGETLAEMLGRKRRLSPDHAAALARDIARALSAAHEKSIVHRDLKPANIFLHNEPGGDVDILKVLDFGVSKSLAGSDGMHTVAGGAVGSPMYMSPEQAQADPTIDGRSDIWSLGVVLFEMITGEKPFKGDALQVIQQVLMGEIPTVSRRVRRIAPAFDELITACLSRRREQRPWPASELARQLEAFADLGGGRASLPSLSSEVNDALGGHRPSNPSSTAALSLISPGYGNPVLQPSSPGHGDTGLRPSSPGYGDTVLRPSYPGPEAAIRPSSPGPGDAGYRSSSPNSGQAARDSSPSSSGHRGIDLHRRSDPDAAPAPTMPDAEDDAATQPLKPSMLAGAGRAPRPFTGTTPMLDPGASHPRSGTLPMADPVVIKPKAGTPDDNTTLPIDAALGMPAGAASERGAARIGGGTLPLTTPEEVLGLRGRGAGGASADGSETSPFAKPIEPADKGGAAGARKKDRLVPVVAAIGVVSLLAAGVIWLTVLRDKSGAPLPEPPAQVSVPVPSVSAPVPSVTTTATAAPAQSSTAAIPPPPVTATATVAPVASASAPKPKLTGRLSDIMPQNCDSKIPTLRPKNCPKKFDPHAP